MGFLVGPPIFPFNVSVPEEGLWYALSMVWLAGGRGEKRKSKFGGGGEGRAMEESEG